MELGLGPVDFVLDGDPTLRISALNIYIMAVFIKIIFVVKIYQIYVLLNEPKKHIA